MLARRRKQMTSRECWARYVCAVLLGGGGTTRVNRYSTRRGNLDIIRALNHAKALGWAELVGGPKSRQEWAITDDGRKAA